jgi:hypothetical protein
MVVKIVKGIVTNPGSMLIPLSEHISPTVEPVGDYITDVEQRQRLFKEFRHGVPKISAFPEDADIQDNIIDATTFACFMVAPVQKIETFLSTAQEIT